MEGWRDGGMEGWRDGGREGERDGEMEGWRRNWKKEGGIRAMKNGAMERGNRWDEGVKEGGMETWRGILHTYHDHYLKMSSHLLP